MEVKRERRGRRTREHVRTVDEARTRDTELVLHERAHLALLTEIVDPDKMDKD